MRELHVVAVSDDGRHVVLATSPDARKGTFRVPLDARLRSAVQGRLAARPAAEAPTAPAAPSVREMQARLRAGESAQDIAASAGIALERVERFAGPVWSEHEKMIEKARATPLLHSRRGLSALPLGEAVDLHFSQIDSLRPESVTWSARREETGTWIVEVGYVARARTRSGSWRYDPADGTLVAADSVSGSLGHSETADGAPSAPAPKRRVPAKAPAGRAATGPAPGRRAAAPATVTARPAPATPPARSTTSTPRRPAVGTQAPPVVARPGAAAPAAKKAAARTAKKAAAPKTKAAAPKAKAAPRTPAAAPKAKRVAAPQPPAAARPATDVPAGPPTLRVVPALDQQPRQPQGARPAGRASVPAWADVLLSTSPPAAGPPPAAERNDEPGEASSD